MKIEVPVELSKALEFRRSNIKIVSKTFLDQDFEFVERKGVGHPDTLADNLAEKLSVEYSNYTLKKFGAVLHHNFDKVGILGGSSYVTFGDGYLTKPLRVLINGRVSTKFGNEVIPYKDLITKWTKDFFKNSPLLLNLEKDLEFHFNLSNQSSPGKTEEKEAEKGTRKYWFEPRGLFDLQELSKLVSNDTSLGVGYAPCTLLEKFVLKIESTLNSEKYKKNNKWMGNDIKVMGFRFKDQFSITMCIPQISKYVKNVDEYKANLDKSRKEIYRIAILMGVEKFNDLNINTRDNYEKRELYLTATGSSVESGDEGLVGRGNRINGVISSYQPFSMEGVCGKNPVYHIGKIYTLAANELAKKIFEKYKVRSEVCLVSQSGRDLTDPWFTIVAIPDNCGRKEEIYSFVESELHKIPELTKGLLEERYLLC